MGHVPKKANFSILWGMCPCPVLADLSAVGEDFLSHDFSTQAVWLEVKNGSICFCHSFHPMSSSQSFFFFFFGQNRSSF